MKTYSQELKINGEVVEIDYHLCDIDYTPEEPQTRTDPYWASEAYLISARFSGTEKEVPQEIIEAFNGNPRCLDGFVQDVENDQRDRAADAAEYRAEAMAEARWEVRRDVG